MISDGEDHGGLPVLCVPARTSAAWRYLSISEIPVKPLRIKQESPGRLRITWDDGLEVVLPTEYLRRKCPCATCLQEAEENRSRGMFPLMLAGQNTIREIRQSGRNAVIVTWGDGHNTGIYTWEYLQRLSAEFSP